MSKDCTIQDVFHRFYPSFESTHSISPAQRKAAYHIMNCKTGAFGVNVSVCEDCGYMSVHYNSCRDRCCPMCQEFSKEKWVDAPDQIHHPVSVPVRQRNILPLARNHQNK